MSKRHQASRRRTYGRRQHELHERSDRFDGSNGWLETSDLQEVSGTWAAQPSGNATERWLQARGID